MKAVSLGVTHFDTLTKFFADNYEAASKVFIETKKHEVSDRKACENLHEAYVNEMKEGFSAVLGKDRLYERACGFVTDQQIWLLGVLRKYFMSQVMHFEHEDFLTALAIDLGPFLS